RCSKSGRDKQNKQSVRRGRSGKLGPAALLSSALQVTARELSFNLTVIFFLSRHIFCKEVDKMERQDRRAQILHILAKSVRRIIEEEVPDFDSLQEIRMRTGQPLRVCCAGRELVLPGERGGHIVTKEELRETMEYISRYSLYAFENELRQG